MELDPEICERARLSRDARFDGRFFIGVVTTGIYCRPICPVQPPKAKNVRFYPSAAAAAEAGFRPCLRCRPESSPGTPAWNGTSAAVSRALRLIEDGALDEGSVEALAEKVGLGGRHLRRLFLQHLGAAPVTFAQTRRLHFAKKLIDETTLPMAQIALSSGYGSIRRFNSAFQKTYGRNPSELRRSRVEETGAATLGPLCLRLSYRPPYDWDSIIKFFASHAAPGVEFADTQTYRRTISLGGKSGRIEVRHAEAKPCLELRIEFPDARAIFQIVERVKRMFDLRADPSEISARLRGDPSLSPLVAARPGLRVPGSWDGFETAIRTILGQQVSVRGAATLTGRLVRAYGETINGSGAGELTHAFPTPESLADADLSSVGLPRARAATIRNLARAVHSGAVQFESSGSSDEFIKAMLEVPGIGDWTVQYVLLRAFGDPDAFPSSDLALVRALNSDSAPMKPKELESRAEVWRPWRSYAAMHLWKSYAESASGNRGRGAPQSRVRLKSSSRPSNLRVRTLR